MQTAALIIIGDELLTGKFSDENGPFTIGLFRKKGISLKRVAFISDDLEEIATAVADASMRFDIVITSGGIGPTHDDITVEGVGMGLKLPLETSPEIVERLERHFSNGVPHAALKMALVPRGARLVDAPGLKSPVLAIGNVHILPGVPSFFRAKLLALVDAWAGPTLHCEQVMTPLREVTIAEVLTEAQNRWSGLSIGSYPRFEAEPFHVVVTVEGLDSCEVSTCVSWLSDNLERRRVALERHE